MSGCVFPGSFDPVTRGHMDLIRRAAGLFDRVTVTVMVNVRKSGCIPAEKREALLRKACAGIPNVRVDRWDGLLADYLRKTGERCVLRGVRSVGEFDAEITAAEANRALYPDMETLLLPATPETSWISSSAVREIAAFSGDVRPFLPEETAEEIAALLSNK